MILKSSLQNVHLQVADGQMLPFENASFDAVFSSWIVEHVASPHKYAAEMHRVLKSGGMAYVEWGPAWTSAKGHHMMRDIGNYPIEPCSTSPIPGWSHLVWSPTEMQNHLVNLGIDNITRVQDVVAIIYFEGESHSNRVPFDVANASLYGPPWKAAFETYHKANDDDCTDELSISMLAEARKKFPSLHDFRTASQSLSFFK